MIPLVSAHKAPVVAGTWRGDGALVTGALDGEVTLWRYDAEAEAARLTWPAEVEQAVKEKKKPPKEPVALVAVKMLERAHPLGVVSISTNPAGNAMVTTGLAGDMHLWDLDEYRRVATVSKGPSEAWKAGYNPTAPQVACGGAGGQVHFYTSGGDKQSSVATGADFISALAFHPDGRSVAVGGLDGSLHVVDVDAQRTVASVAAHALPVRGVAFSPDGTMLFTASDDRRVHVYDASGLGGSAATTTTGAPSLVCSMSGHLHWATCVAAAPDKHILASSSADKTVKVWDVRRRDCVHTFEGHSDKVWACGWNPAGTRIMSVSEVGTLGLHSVAGVV